MAPDSDRIKGQAKEAVGAATDDDELRREGKADQTAGKTKDKLKHAVDSVKDKLTGH